MNRDKLESASEQGIITKEQVESLLTFFKTDDTLKQSHSEDQLKFVRSFGDVFITLGIVFVSVASAQINMGATWQNIVPLLLLIVATEWLVRGRRLVLPGMALLVSSLYFSCQLLELSIADYGLLNLMFVTSLAGLFYWRYKIPFTMLPIALGCIGMLSIIIDIDLFNAQYMLTMFGLIIFAVAMWFDAYDVDRNTRFSDAAFWLHLLAAPLIVHGVMVNLLVSQGDVVLKELFIIVFFIFFFLLALYVDRRALLVSSLSYAIYAVIALSKTNAFDIENLTLLIFAGFGAFIIFFGTYWYKIRSIIFSRTSTLGMSQYVPGFVEK